MRTSRPGSDPTANAMIHLPPTGHLLGGFYGLSVHGGSGYGNFGECSVKGDGYGAGSGFGYSSDFWHDYPRFWGRGDGLGEYGQFLSANELASASFFCGSGDGFGDPWVGGSARRSHGSHGSGDHRSPYLPAAQNAPSEDFSPLGVVRDAETIQAVVTVLGKDADFCPPIAESVLCSLSPILDEAQLRQALALSEALEER